MGATIEDIIVNVVTKSKGHKEASRGMQGMLMQFLGIMFFGMAMTRMFGSMLKPAADLFGLFDIWAVTLQTVFLPIMELLFEPLMSLMTWFMDLPEPIKKAIGVFALVGLGLGQILSVVGQLVMGVGGLILLFAGPAGLAAAGTVVSTAFLALLPILAIIGVAIALAVVAWKTNFGGFRDFVKDTWERIKNIISGFVDLIRGSVTADFDLMAQGVEKIWANMAVFLVNSFVFSINFIKNLFFKMITDMLFGIALFASSLSKIPGLGFLKGGAEALALASGGISGLGEATNLGLATTSAKEGGGIKIDFSPVFDIKVNDKAELERIMTENAKKQVDELRRLTRTG